MTITAWEPGRRMAVHHRGAVSGTGEFVLKDGAESSTVLEWREDLTFPWWLAGSMGARLARPVLTLLWRGNLQALCAIIEGAPSE